MIARDQVCLGILAGGQGRRLGGVDKAFLNYDGKTLLERCLQSAGNGFAQRLISHPGAEVRFTSNGLEAVKDVRPGQQGPLAGLEALLTVTRSQWLLTIPVDVKTLPLIVFETLLRLEDGPGRVIRDADGLQPLIALWRVSDALAIVQQRLDAGQRDAQGLVAALGLMVCELSPMRLGNLNTPHDFEDSPA